MGSESKTWLKRIILLAGALLLLLALRIPGLSQPYHQDEFDWAMVALPNSPVAGVIPHPPISEFVFTTAGRLFANDNLRMMPFMLSIANLFLLYVVVKRRYGVKPALVSAFLYALAFFSVLASLMLDNDGQTLPLLFLLSIYCYDKWRESVGKRARIVWLACFATAMVLGFLTKMCFVIPAFAFVLDFLMEKRLLANRKMWLKVGAGLAGAAVVLAVALWNAHYIFAHFDIRSSFHYWTRFMDIAHRGWLQIVIQGLKGVMYLSPLLVAPLLLSSKEQRTKARLFWIFGLAAFVFYFILFDFSAGALDRYMEVFIVPLVVISSLVYAELLDAKMVGKKWLLTAALSGVVLFALQFLPHYVPPHHPKSEWFWRIASFRWNFLFPFSGGSGPLGFYVSFLMIAVCFLACGVCIAVSWYRPRLRAPLILVVAALGLSYNLAFNEEYLTGRINGFTPVLLWDALAALEARPEIKQVISYNDIGSYYLTNMGRYYRRLYAVPEYDESNIEKMNGFNGYYLVIDFPRINPDSIYAKFFSRCRPVYSDVSGLIKADVLDCRDVPIR